VAADVQQESGFERELPALGVRLHALLQEVEAPLGLLQFLGENERAEDVRLRELRIEIAHDPHHMADHLELLIRDAMLSVVLDPPQPGHVGRGGLVPQGGPPGHESGRVIEQLIRVARRHPGLHRRVE
jgi:hypothetical protein